MDRNITLFDGPARIAAGPATDIFETWRRALDRNPHARLLAFDDATGRVVDLPAADTEVAPRPRGRPKLGVTAREVTLLPRHWAWLAEQRGGASATLRRLVEQASRQGEDPVRHARDAAYRFMQAMAGDFPDYEEALRALYAGDAAAFRARTESWPADVRTYALALAAEGIA